MGSGPPESQKKMGAELDWDPASQRPFSLLQPPGQGPDVQFGLTNHRFTSNSLSLILIFQTPEAGSKAAVGSGVGEGKRRGGKLKDCRTQSPVPSLHRMTVMSLVVLVLSWGSLGLEAATAVVSAGARSLGSETQGAGGPNSWILGWWSPMP